MKKLPGNITEHYTIIYFVIIDHKNRINIIYFLSHMNAFRFLVFSLKYFLKVFVLGTIIPLISTVIP